MNHKGKVRTERATEIYAIPVDEAGWRMLPNGGSVKLGNNVSIGDNVVLGQHVRIGNNVIVGDNVEIEDGVRLGDDVVIDNNQKVGLFSEIEAGGGVSSSRIKIN